MTSSYFNLITHSTPNKVPIMFLYVFAVHVLFILKNHEFKLTQTKQIRQVKSLPNRICFLIFHKL